MLPSFLTDLSRFDWRAFLADYYLVFLISIPLSLLLYLYFSKHRHWIVVDLGHHRWLTK